MFESDQSDLHEEIAELRQQSPKAAVNPQADVRDSSFYEREDEEESEDNFPEDREETKKKQFPFLMFGAGALAIIVVLVLFVSKPKKTDAPPPGDLGPGVSAQAGLKGHLLTQWDGSAKSGSVQYQLRMEPIGPRQAAGFALVNTNPSGPYSINMRLLDASGFALCGKEILFHFDPKNAPVTVPASTPLGKKGAAARAAAEAARKAELNSMIAAEADRERGKDIFQNQAGADGEVTAVNAKGTLPCSPDQYKRAYYWDFTTSFPTVDEQFAMVDPKAAAAAKKEKESPNKADAHDAHRKSALKKPLSAYYIQGDDRVTSFDPTRGVLEATAGKSFTIPNRPEQTIAANWAHNYSLIHYKCDQHASCALTSAGGMSVVYGRMNE
jgi:hypothetical protein